MTDQRESERRIATVMFADISGFTAMSEKLDPEEITALMNEVFKIIGSIIERYGGRIDKFIGDCVMATFGVPTAIENAPQKAINTAIEIRNRLYQFNKEKNLNNPLDIHIGINTGNVLAGIVGSDQMQQYTVMGDSVNIASRLEDASKTGQILVGRDTYKATKDSFEYKELKPVSVKGKEKPVPVFELLSTKTKTARRKIGSDRMIHSEIVGRDNELNKLELQVNLAINGKGSIVNVVGEGGIGKSRLIAELKAREVMQRVTLLEGRALSMGRNLSFYPIIEFLKQWAGITEDDGDSSQISKLENLVRGIFPEEVNEVVPFVATLMGIRLSGKHANRIEGIEGEGLEKLIMKNLREFMRKATNDDPYMIVLDDMHWSDTSSIELLEALFRLAETQKILFINVFRPRYEETSDKIVNIVKENYPDHLVEINLHSLDDKESETLVNNLVDIKGLPVSIKNQILERAGGNPFFIEEVVRSFIDTGAIVLKDDQFEVTGKIDKVVIPQTINEVLMSRIDQLDEKTKDLVKVASVIGRNFFHKILNDVAGTVEHIDNKLDYLKEIQIIREGKRLEEVEFLFKHALAQETAYESILLKKRKELHLKVAESIENVFNERLHEFYGMLAYHYSNAENMDKAEEYMIKAGEAAMQSSASSEALEYFQNALELYTRKYRETLDPMKIAELRESIGFALFNKGKFSDAIAYFDKVLEYLRQKPSIVKQSSSIRFIIEVLFLFKLLYFSKPVKMKTPNAFNIRTMNIVLTQSKALVTTDQRRIDFLTVIKDLDKFDILNHQVFFDSFVAISAGITLGAYPSIKLSSRILNCIERRIQHVGNHIDLDYYRFVEKLHNNFFATGTFYHDDRIVKKLMDKGDIHSASSYLYLSIQECLLIGDFAIAMEYIGMLKGIWHEFSGDYSTSLYFICIGNYLMATVKKSQIKEKLDEILEWLGKVVLKLFEARLFAVACRLSVLNNDFKLAESTIDKSIELFTNDSNEIVSPSNYLIILINKLHFEISKYEKSLFKNESIQSEGFEKSFLKYARNAITIGKTFRLINSELHRYIGIFHWLTNKQRKALKWFDKSIKEGERLGARPDLSRTYMEVGKRLMEPKSKYKHLNGITADEYLDKAEVLFKEMDLQWDLEQLEKIRQGISVPIN